MNTCTNCNGGGVVPWFASDGQIIGHQDCPECNNVGATRPKETTPRIEIEDVASTWGELYTKLSSGQGLPERPFWLMFGDSGFKITDQNRDTLALGMMLGLDAKLNGLK